MHSNRHSSLYCRRKFGGVSVCFPSKSVLLCFNFYLKVLHWQVYSALQGTVHYRLVRTHLGYSLELHWKVYLDLQGTVHRLAQDVSAISHLQHSRFFAMRTLGSFPLAILVYITRYCKLQSPLCVTELSGVYPCTSQLISASALLLCF